MDLEELIEESTQFVDILIIAGPVDGRLSV
jgi:hypothetical protein